MYICDKHNLTMSPGELDHTNRGMYENDLTGLPRGIFDSLTAMTYLYVMHLSILSPLLLPVL